MQCKTLLHNNLRFIFPSGSEMKFAWVCLHGMYHSATF